MIGEYYKNKKVLIAGLGLYPKGSGISAAKFFISQGAEVTITDLKTRKELMPQIKAIEKFAIRKKNAHKPRYTLERHLKRDFKSADLVIKNPGMSKGSPYLQASLEAEVPIETDISIFMQAVSKKLVFGITGTRGKSTTSALLYEMLKKKYKDVHLGGNIQNSPLNFFSKLNQKSLVVLELSSWMLESLKRSPHIAIVTNIMKDHLNTYKNMAGYVAAKERIFRFQGPDDFLILNYDDVTLRKMARRAKAKVVYFSKYKERFHSLSYETTNVSKSLYNWIANNMKTGGGSLGKKFQYRGKHNFMNALAAATAARILKISEKDIKAAIKEFRGLPGRLEFVHQSSGIKFYNDTTATIPEATIAALAHCRALRLQSSRDKSQISSGWRKGAAPRKNIILICGGSDKKLDYHELAKYIKRYSKTVILLPGRATDKIKLEIEHFPTRPVLVEVGNMSEAVGQANRSAECGDIVLLSPAAASFGLFKNEFDRGEQFVREIKTDKMLKVAL